MIINKIIPPPKMHINLFTNHFFFSENNITTNLTKQRFQPYNCYDKVSKINEFKFNQSFNSVVSKAIFNKNLFFMSFIDLWGLKFL